MKTREQLAKRYRIVTDGDRYRVQYRWLWRWEYLCRYTMSMIMSDSPGEPVDFPSLEKADAQIDDLVESAYRAQKDIWTVIGND